MKAKILLMALLMVVLTFSLVGCGEEVPLKVSGINLSQTQLEIAEGEVHTLYAEVYPPNAEDAKVDWKSTNEEVATISRGSIVAKDTGSCKVYATTSGGEISAVCDVVVGDGFLRVSNRYNQEQEGYGRKFFATISEAVSACGEDSVIICEDGEYEEIVNISKSVTIKGYGAEILGGFVVGYPKLDSEVEDINIEGFTFKIGKKNGMQQMAGIYVGNDVDDLKITSCTFVGNFAKDVESGGENISQKAMANSNSYSKWNSGDISIGILCIPNQGKTAVKDMEISSCVFENLHYAMMFLPYVAESKIFSNNFQDCEYAMRLAGTKRLDVEGNYFSRSGVVQFGFSENLSDMIKIKNNQIDDFPETFLVEACEGNINSGFTLDLSENEFAGILPKEMTKEEYQLVISKICGKEKEGKLKNIKLESDSKIKKIMENDG